MKEMRLLLEKLERGWVRKWFFNKNIMWVLYSLSQSSNRLSQWVQKTLMNLLDSRPLSKGQKEIRFEDQASRTKKPKLLDRFSGWLKRSFTRNSKSKSPNDMRIHEESQDRGGGVLSYSQTHNSESNSEGFEMIQEEGHIGFEQNKIEQKGSDETDWVTSTQTDKDQKITSEHKINFYFNQLACLFWVLDSTPALDSRLKGKIRKLAPSIFVSIQTEVSPNAFWSRIRYQKDILANLSAFPYDLHHLIQKVSRVKQFVNFSSNPKNEEVYNSFLAKVFVTKSYFDFLGQNSADSLRFYNRLSVDTYFLQNFFDSFRNLLNNQNSGHRNKIFKNLESSDNLQTILILFKNLVGTIDLLEDTFLFLRNNGVTENMLTTLFSMLMRFIIKVSFVCILIYHFINIPSRSLLMASWPFLI